MATSWLRLSRCARLGSVGRCVRERQAAMWGEGGQCQWRGRLMGTQAKRGVAVREGMSVSELARALGASPMRVRAVLHKSGHGPRESMPGLPLEVCQMVAKEMGQQPIQSEVSGTTSKVQGASSLLPRPPVVTVMGHVDHGKTTLLDSLRKTSVAASEAGGITQHIGAFSVSLGTGHHITFLDTPGHAAFSAMRARGTNITDIVVLVVAADDGIMRQTVECIQLVQETRVPLVVAINKCDKRGVDVPRVKRQLLQHGVQLEEFGGDVQAVEVSALKGTGLASLEEAILVLAEVCDLRADPRRPVGGVVVESRVDKGLGPVATVLVQQGTLRPGTVLVAGTAWGKVRRMLGEGRKTVPTASPSTPVLTVGWREVPVAGDKCVQVGGEQEARRIVRDRATVSYRPGEGGREGEVVPVVVKGDVVGSVEALVGVLTSSQPEQIGLSVVHSGVGQVSETDVELASSVKGILLAFNVSCTKATAALARQRDVTVLSHNVIYKLVDMLKSELEASLPTVSEEEVLGEAVILQVFQLRGAKAAAVGGCRVKQGRLVRNGVFRVVRDGKVVHEGPVVAMKHGQNNIDTARKETECGISFSSDPGFMEGDSVICFTRKQSHQKLNWDVGF